MVVAYVLLGADVECEVMAAEDGAIFSDGDGRLGVGSLAEECRPFDGVGPADADGEVVGGGDLVPRPADDESVGGHGCDVPPGDTDMYGVEGREHLVGVGERERLVEDGLERLRRKRALQSRHQWLRSHL